MYLKFSFQKWFVDNGQGKKLCVVGIYKYSIYIYICMPCSTQHYLNIIFVLLFSMICSLSKPKLDNLTTKLYLHLYVHGEKNILKWQRASQKDMDRIGAKDFFFTHIHTLSQTHKSCHRHKQTLINFLDWHRFLSDALRCRS